ncbi:MAG: pyridoxal-phosphate dependent enzyme, partial [Proteobacteria bacterium]|nr:pyridoxal-phosphate dependent enzyme [Pseudomonadota bacterium]
LIVPLLAIPAALLLRPALRQVGVVAAGSTGTLAGLTLGLRLAGPAVPVRGVQVAPGIVANPKNAVRLARRTLGLMQRTDPSVPKPTLVVAPLIRRHYGEGYGHPTQAGQEALDLLAETEGVDLDPTYTAKAMAALLEYVRQARPAGPVLFWHTFNSVKLATDGLSPATLPPRFHRFFTGAPLS